MNDIPVTAKQLRILLACARPMAGRTLKVDVRLRAVDNANDADGLDSLLRNRLKLTILEKTAEDDRIHFHLAAPLPDPSYLESKIRQSADVLDVFFTEGGGPIDLIRPGEERQSILKVLYTFDRSVAVDLLDHVKPQDLREHLDAAPGYDVLYLTCHGDGARKNRTCRH